jgi:predicted metalloprotease with PDZ domain
MRPRLTTFAAATLFLTPLSASCHPPDFDPPDEEEAAEGELDSAPAQVTPRQPRGDAIEHTLRFPNPETHYVEAESVFPTAGEEELTLFLAVWTPGSYLVREFSGHLESLSAASLDGQELRVTQVRKNRWTVSTAGHDRVVVRHRVYARVLTVQGSFVDDTLAVLNGAGLFLCPVGRLDLEHDVLLELSEETYPRLATSLPPHVRGGRRYVARDYDTLLDSPIVAGAAEMRSFEVGGATFELWTFGGDALWDHDRAARDVQKIVEAQAGFWGVVPFERYLFLNVAEDGGGGLEHLESTLMMTNRFSMRRGEDYRRWLGLVSHELFHAWNGKRLRPDVLGPFDYETEVRTPSLWIVEGLTSYYDDLFLRRAGLLTESQYLARLGDNVEQLMTTPGRDVQSLSESSADTWTKFYRRDENSGNSTISYYNKGSLVGFLLDAHVRQATRGAASLDDVMRLMYERHSGERGYAPEDFRLALEEVLGESPVEHDTDSPPGSADALLDAWVDGVEPLPLEEALAYYGLDLKGDDGVSDGPGHEDEEEDDGEEDDEEIRAWLGVETDGSWITEIVRGGPAFESGINFDDEIIAIDGYRVRGLAQRLLRYRPGDEVTFTVARRGRLREIAVTLGSPPSDDAFELIDQESVTALEQRHRAAWLETLRPLPDAPTSTASGAAAPAASGAPPAPPASEQDGADTDHEDRTDDEG